MSSSRAWAPDRIGHDEPRREPERGRRREAAGTGPAPRLVPAAPAGQPAVVLICDLNYVIPTLATALSVARHTRNVRVCLFVVGGDPETIGAIGNAVRDTMIEVRPAELARFGEYAGGHRDRYLPPIALARFWLDELLDPEIDRFLYLDGDIMVDGELDSLLAAPPPEGRIMAVPDALSIYFGDRGRGRAGDLAYLEGLRCAPEQYFNSGVLYVSRATWAEIVPVAKSFLLEHPDRCRSSDQSALNFAARERVQPLPLRYNYQSEHMMALDPRPRGLHPRIWHFSSAPKPWDAAGWPWEGGFDRYYREAAALLAGGAVPTPETPPAQAQAGLGHRRRTRFRLAWLYPWRKLARRSRILRRF